MADFNYNQRGNTPEWDKNYNNIFGRKDEEGHEDNTPYQEESGDE